MRGKRLTAFFLVAVMVFCGTFGTISYAQGGEEDIREFTPRLGELMQAVELGFGNDVDDTSKMTYAQYAKMLDKLIVEVCKRDGKNEAEVEALTKQRLGIWQKRYLKARVSNQYIDRSNAIYMMYVCARDVLGGDYFALRDYLGYYGQEWTALHAENDAALGSYSVNREYFEDCMDEETELVGNFSFTRNLNAYFYFLEKRSQNGYLIFDCDDAEQMLRTEDILTRQEAMLSAVRMYNCVDAFELKVGAPENQLSVSESGADAEKVYHYNEDIITDKLRANAQYMEALTPSLYKLPAYSGIEYDWTTYLHRGSQIDSLSEAKFREAADLGFNYVRVTISCKNFFGVGLNITEDDLKDIPQTTDRMLTDEQTGFNTVDLACLTKLDEVVAYGLKYGLHINLQMFDYPGHIMFMFDSGVEKYDLDFSENTVKQQQAARMWSLFAKRYKNIPNSALSFTINHEPSRGNCSNPTTIKSATKVIYDAVKAADKDRFLYCEDEVSLIADTYMTDMDGDGKPDLGHQFLGFPNAYTYWTLQANGLSGYGEVSAVGGYLPDWPNYRVPGALHANSDGKVNLSFDGCLPAGTKIDFKGFTFEEALTVTGTAYDGALSPENVYSKSLTFSAADRTYTSEHSTNFSVSLTLDKAVDKLVFTMGDTDEDMHVEDLTVTLPKEYETKKIYMEGFQDRVWDDPTDVTELRTNSEVEVKCSPYWTTSYIPDISAAAINTETEVYLWHLDNSADYKVTICEDGTYTTNYGWTKEGLKRTVKAQKEKMDNENAVGLCLELFVPQCIMMDSVSAYLDDMMSVYNECGVPYVFYCELFLYWTMFDTTAKRTLQDGMMRNMAIVDVVKKHMQPRPHIMVKVTKGNNPLEEPDYIYAAIYEDEAGTKLDKVIGTFSDMKDVADAADGETGYLYLYVGDDKTLTDLPTAASLSGVVVIASNNSECITLPCGELDLACDVHMRNDVRISGTSSDSELLIKGNGHKLYLGNSDADRVTLAGDGLRADALDMVCYGEVCLAADIDGLSTLYLNEIASCETGTNVTWENRYMLGGAHYSFESDRSGEC